MKQKIEAKSEQSEKHLVFSTLNFKITEEPKEDVYREVILRAYICFHIYIGALLDAL